MAALCPMDIACGVNFAGQNVDCSTNPPLQRFLVPFINSFVNALLQESLVKNVAPNRILKLKKGIFYLSSISQYYDLFLQNMTQAAPDGPGRGDVVKRQVMVNGLQVDAVKPVTCLGPR